MVRTCADAEDKKSKQQMTWAIDVGQVDNLRGG
jgi:hypothetical protein